MFEILTRTNRPFSHGWELIGVKFKSLDEAKDYIAEKVEKGYNPADFKNCRSSPF